MWSGVRALRAIVDDARASPDGYPFDWPICTGLSCVNHEHFKAKATRKLARHVDDNLIPTHLRFDLQMDNEPDEALAARIEETQNDGTPGPAEEEVDEAARPSKRRKTDTRSDFGGQSATQIVRASGRDIIDEAASAARKRARYIIQKVSRQLVSLTLG
jgi:hypothetical protein